MVAAFVFSRHSPALKRKNDRVTLCIALDHKAQGKNGDRKLCKVCGENAGTLEADV